MTRSSRFLLLAAFMITGSAPARCEVVHGFQQLRPYYIEGLPSGFSTDAFDFSAQAIVHYLSAVADLAYQEWDHDWEFHASNGAGIVKSNTALEDIKLAPTEGYVWSAQVIVGQVCMTKTSDALFAKFRVQGFELDGFCCSITIEYYVQMDGSRSFDPLVATKPTTWGNVKALYR